MTFTYHPNAQLSSRRNTNRGLISRSKILYALEKRPSSGKELSEETQLPYRVVLYHLHLFFDEGLVNFKGNRPHVWFLTGFGQKRLM